MVGGLNMFLLNALQQIKTVGKVWRAGLLLSVLGGLVPGSVLAQQDPTRPPAVLVETSAPETEETEAPPPLGLQTVLLRKNAKPLAIINGQSVELGGLLGELRLIRLTETEAVLQGPNGQEILRLMPDAERKTIVPPKPPAVAQDMTPGKKAGKRSKTNSTLTK